MKSVQKLLRNVKNNERKRLLMTFIMSMCGIMLWAQTPNYRMLMDQAKQYFEQKDYKNAIECYERIVAELKGTDFERLVPSIRTSIAINNLYLGVAEMKDKNFTTAKFYLDKALQDAQPDSKTYDMALSWLGQWNSVQSQSIRIDRGDLQQALQFCLEAERYFDLAKAPEKRLKEQLARADIYQELTHNEEAKGLLKQIMAECQDVSDYSFIMGRAAYKWGSLELQEENFQVAIQLLEQGYDLCAVGSTASEKSFAYLCAMKLSQLFTSKIPDDEKAELWSQRAAALESQTAK